MEVVLFGCGLLVFSLIEYVHHRWGGHTKVLGAMLFNGHQDHHVDPHEAGKSYRDKLLHRLPLVLVLSCCLAVFFSVFLGGYRGWVVLGGIIVGYLYSEWFHHRMHHKLPSNSVERWLWRVHYIHHFSTTKKNYGFTSPIWDIIFGTYQHPSSNVPVPNSKVPRGLEFEKGFREKADGALHNE
jgi:sterol desaturase/sphingolipid hydroxylase (fatty acid hydroxylase superfamily)